MVLPKPVVHFRGLILSISWVHSIGLILSKWMVHSRRVVLFVYRVNSIALILSRPPVHSLIVLLSSYRVHSYFLVLSGTMVHSCVLELFKRYGSLINLGTLFIHWFTPVFWNSYYPWFTHVVCYCRAQRFTRVV